MEWKEVRLGDIATMQYGKLAPKKKDAGNVPIFTGYKNVGYTDKINCNKNTIVVVARGVGGCGDVKITNEDCYLTNLAISVSLNAQICVPMFFYYLHQLENLSILNSGSAQPQITIESLTKYSFRIPSLDDQHRIASILSSLDRKIELNNKINADLEEMAQAIFKNWFVDFEPFKDSKFVDSELGMIPEGWKVGTLADIAEITMGQSPAGNSLNENREGMIFYQGSSDFSFRFPGIRVFTTEPKRLAVANSVLFSVRAPVGDINVAQEECCIGRGVASIKSKYGHDSYLFYTMKSLHKLFDSFDGEGTVFGSINKKTLSAIQILLPSDGIVEQFNNIASSFDNRIRSLSEESSRLSLLRDTLLPRLMSGELEVPE
jgi:type I restriction enzyme, S subunit